MWHKESSLLKLEHYTQLLYKLKIFSEDDKNEIISKIKAYQKD
ncbi:hypothetical protein ACFQPF_08380 [Fictibacillus iocasae]|uniref:Uncharacterized protein n=1 Tax=Fictibacillus iocasae TaxID=2715437 RepID=A0ABW2NMN8_9BACL